MWRRHKKEEFNPFQAIKEGKLCLEGVFRAAAGVPSVYFVTKDATYRGAWYHSQLDTTALIDWSYLGDNVKLYGLVQQSLDTSVLPYDFTARAAQFADNFDTQALVDAGASAAKVSKLGASLDAFTTAGSSWAAHSSQVPARRVAAVNTRLMKAEKILNGALTGLDQWDSTTYPHAQLLDDVQDLHKAIVSSMRSMGCSTSDR